MIVTLHGSDFPEFARSRPRFVAATLRHADKVILLSEQARAALLEVAPTVRTAVVPNPIVVDEEAPGAGSTPPVVLFAGTVGRRKGVDRLVAAWKLLLAEGIEGRCRIIGPIDDYVPPATERLTVEGPIPPDRVRALLRSVRVVALPSFAEGMPMILTEALAGARPFVATPVGGTAQIAPTRACWSRSTTCPRWPTRSAGTCATRSWRSGTGYAVNNTSRPPAARASSTPSCAASTRAATLRRVELAGGQLTVSAMGFGCGALMQSPSRKDRMAVLSAALDSGITHFDTARMYGLGRAEAELGTFLRTVDRDSVTIATKFGIDVGGAARRLGRFQAPARALLKKPPATARVYDAAGAARSLERSLTALGVDYVDILFVHAPRPQDTVAAAQLCEFFERARGQGKIRAWGVSQDEGLEVDFARAFAPHGISQLRSDLPRAADLAFAVLRRPHAALSTAHPVCSPG